MIEEKEGRKEVVVLPDVWLAWTDRGGIHSSVGDGGALLLP